MLKKSLVITSGNDHLRGVNIRANAVIQAGTCQTVMIPTAGASRDFLNEDVVPVVDLPALSSAVSIYAAGLSVEHAWIYIACGFDWISLFDGPLV